MPISERLANSIRAGFTDESVANDLGAALEVLGITTLTLFLGCKGSFESGTIVEAQLAALCASVRRQADDSDTPSGGYATFVADAHAIPRLRAVVIAARREFKLEEADALAPAPPEEKEDLFKPLPPKEVNDLWEAGEAVTSGFSWVPPKHKLSDSIMSRMQRANRNGELWLPAIDGSFKYLDPAQSRLVSTLLGSADGDGAGGGVALQLVQGGGHSERRDAVHLAADYCEMLSHRSSAVLACYSTPEASVKYMDSARGKRIAKHSLIASSAKPAVQILCRMVAKLERQLRGAARLGLSTRDLLAVDKQVIDAIAARSVEVSCDGNLAIEYVCDQRTSLFEGPQGAVCSSVAASSSGGASVGGRGAGEQPPRQPGADGTDWKRKYSELQSQVDKAKNQQQKTVYGGRTGVMGGGGGRNQTSVCNQFNEERGCYRKDCKFAHVCNKQIRQGQMCRDDRHCALFHR